jgi:hypothetical protein
MEEKLVNWIKRPVVMRSIYIVSCMVISFALGVATEFSVQNRGNQPVLQIPEKPLPLAYRYKSPVAKNPMDLVPAVEAADTATESTGSSMAFVASKTGKTFYPAGCAGINRIKVENRIYFATEKEAEDKGLTRSVTCN